MSTKKRKILVISPGPYDLWDASEKEYYRKYLPNNYQVDFTFTEFGSDNVESYYDKAITTPYILEKVLEGEKNGYDAIIIACYDDPGVEAAREIAEIPVIGPGEASLHIASMLGFNISIVSPGIGGGMKRGKCKQKFEIEKHERIGLSRRITSMRGIGLDCSEIDKESLERLFSLLLTEGKKAVEEDLADVLVLGCSGLKRFAEKLQEKLGVPVIDPLVAALKMAEVLVDMNLHQSKIVYSKPRDIPRKYPPSLKRRIY